MGHHDISRRRMLALSAAAGGFAITGARAQAAKRIEQFDAALDKIIDTSEPIKELASGFGGDLGPAEGPVWCKEGGYLLFSDIHNNRRMKYTPGQGVALVQEPTNRANGLTRDLQGRVVACEHDSRRVTRQEHDGSITVIANSFQGRRLNRPNDVVVKSDGCIYFTDPWTSPLPASTASRPIWGPSPCSATTLSYLTVSPSLPMKACSTLTTPDAAISGPLPCCPTAPSRSKPTGSLSTYRVRSRAFLTV